MARLVTSFVIATLLCFGISILIVYFGHNLLAPVLGSKIAWYMSGLIEVAFLSIYWIAVTSGNFNQWDMAMKGFLFFLSVVPPTGYLSEELMKKWDQKIAVRPVEPQKPERMVILQNEIKDLTRQIDNLINTKSTYSADLRGRAWYQSKDQKVIDKKTALKKEYIADFEKLENKFKADQTQYSRDFKQYEELSSKASYRWIRDISIFIWALVGTLFLQFVNTRLSWHSVVSLQKLVDKTKEEHVTDLELFLQERKVSGVSDKTIGRFCKRSNMKTVGELNAFMLVDGWEETAKVWLHQSNHESFLKMLNSI